MKKLISSILIWIFLIGCQSGIDNPSASEVLRNNPDADIFQWNGGFVYSNMSGAEYIDRGFEPDEKIGEIKRQTDRRWFFRDGSATQLPEGTSIYKPAGNAMNYLIAIVDGEEVLYRILLEG
ncbi:hypothetical protein [Alteribacter aurantiacus]|uniref:hypothetical protein n=1 Tax=Alteribacter aurantiacus TaxID=254410 RepID=UPI0004133522|nr:hypothetical protein [Alteribacter aurantiacus]